MELLPLLLLRPLLHPTAQPLPPLVLKHMVLDLGQGQTG
jgi:hypothetical protein